MTTILTAGLGLKPQHYAAALDSAEDGLWFEVHPENYMVAGGPRLAWLEAMRERHPLSLHGVALSLAADTEPDPVHLARLTGLVRRIEPDLLSEHLAWSAWRGAYHPDLLPFPRTSDALARIADNVARTQDAGQRRIAVENPSNYLLIDTHATPVAPEVWTLYERLIRRIGARPTLIERDDKLPDFATLVAERERERSALRPSLASRLKRLLEPFCTRIRPHVGGIFLTRRFTRSGRGTALTTHRPPRLTGRPKARSSCARGDCRAWGRARQPPTPCSAFQGRP